MKTDTSPRARFERYVERAGGPKALSTASGISFSTLAGVCNGARGIGFQLAAQLAKYDPKLRVERLILVRPTRPTNVRLAAVNRRK